MAEDTPVADTPVDQAAVPTETPDTPVSAGLPLGESPPGTPPEGAPGPGEPLADTPQPPAQTPPQAEAVPPQAETPPERVVPAAAEYEAPKYVTPQMREFAHKQGFTQEQFNGTLQQMGSMLKAQDSVQRSSLVKAGKQQMKEWGPEAKSNMVLANKGLQYLDPGGSLTKILKETGYNHHPAVLQQLHALGVQVKEGGFLRSNVNVKPRPKSMAHRLYPNDVPK